MTFTQQQDDQYDRAVEASRSAARRFGYETPKDGMLVAALHAEQRTIPTSTDMASPWWSVFFAQHRSGFDEWTDKAWEENEERLAGMAAAETRHREAKAADEKTLADGLAAAERQRTADDLAEMTESIRRRFLSVPGTTETDFQAVLPRLIEDERLRLMKEHQSFEEETLALARQRIRQRF